MSIKKTYGVLTVAHWEPALDWCAKLFDRPADRIMMDGCAEWDTGEGGGVQLLRDEERAGKALLTLSVDDYESRKAALASRGLTGEEISSDQFFLLRISDPEGNIVTFAQPKS